jgi:uncharacterized iron-regulated membrane protein
VRILSVTAHELSRNEMDGDGPLWLALSLCVVLFAIFTWQMWLERRKLQKLQEDLERDLGWRS